MKKNLFILLFSLFVMIPNGVKAGAVCAYSFPDNDAEQRKIYVHVKKNSYDQNVWRVYVTKNGDTVVDIEGTDIFKKMDGTDIIASTAVVDSLHQLKCPKLACYDEDYYDAIGLTNDPKPWDSGNGDYNQFDSDECTFWKKYEIVDEIELDAEVVGNKMQETFKAQVNYEDFKKEEFTEEEIKNIIEGIKNNASSYIQQAAADTCSDCSSSILDIYSNLLEDEVETMYETFENEAYAHVDSIREGLKEEREKAIEEGNDEYVEVLDEAIEKTDVMEEEMQEIITLNDLVGFISDIGSITITPLNDCESLLGNPNVSGSPAWYLKLIFEIIRYIAIGILIVMSVMDFVSATASHDNDIIKKAASKALKRFILCIVIWVLPTIIGVFLNYIDQIPNDLCIQ